MSKYQVAIIGTNIGAKHYEDFQKVSDRFNVHTICGLTKEPVENILPANSDTKISLLQSAWWYTAHSNHGC